MIVVLLEMLSGACLLVVPFLSLRTQLPRPLCLCVIMMFLTKITLNGFQGGKKKHKGVLFAFSFFSKVLTSYYKCQDKGGIFFFLIIIIITVIIIVLTRCCIPPAYRPGAEGWMSQPGPDDGTLFSAVASAEASSAVAAVGLVLMI